MNVRNGGPASALLRRPISSAGGEELGVVVTLINYPRFPAPVEEAERELLTLGRKIMNRCNQGSFSVVGPERTLWVSRRKGD